MLVALERVPVSLDSLLVVAQNLLIMLCQTLGVGGGRSPSSKRLLTGDGLLQRPRCSLGLDFVVQLESLVVDVDGVQGLVQLLGADSCGAFEGAAALFDGHRDGIRVVQLGQLYAIGVCRRSVHLDGALIFLTATAEEVETALGALLLLDGLRSEMLA